PAPAQEGQDEAPREGRRGRGRGRGRGDRARREAGGETTQADAGEADETAPSRTDDAAPAPASRGTAMSRAIAAPGGHGDADEAAETAAQAHSEVQERGQEDVPAPDRTPVRPAAQAEPYASMPAAVTADRQAPMPAAAAAVPAPSMPALPEFELPTDQLHALADAAGLQWVDSDPEKVSAAQAAMAAEPPPIRVPREPKPVVVADEGPLVLVETRKDLSQIRLPFESSAG
ncbi:MAG: ribonuclease E/G, partial [Rubrivivax sp.]|nr:ribonuclease E/G [Rubrivivax sp.]